MASYDQVRNAARRYGLGRRDVQRLTRLLQQTKRDVFAQTLAELGDQLGVAITPTAKALLPVRIDAGNQARRIAENFNRDLARYAFTQRDLPAAELNKALGEWVGKRNRVHAPLIAITESYTSHADATMAAFLELVPDAEFDFGGHPEKGDEPPECAICQALHDTNPHPASRVVAIGNPHPGCRQHWHARNIEALKEQLQERGVDAIDLNKGGGIAGRRSLIERAGSRTAAADAVRSGKIPR